MSTIKNKVMDIVVNWCTFTDTNKVTATLSLVTERKTKLSKKFKVIYSPIYLLIFLSCISPMKESCISITNPSLNC